MMVLMPAPVLPDPTPTDTVVYARLEEIELFYAARPCDREHVRGAIVMMAEAFVGVREIKSSNTGHWINQFHNDLGLGPGLYWCLMFVQYVLQRVSAIWGRSDLLPFNTAGTKRLWQICEARKLVTTDPARFSVADIPIYADGSSGGGHTGILVERDDTRYTNVEGNVGASWRDGGGIEHRTQVYDKWGPVGTPRGTGRWTRGVIRFDLLFDQWGALA